VSISVALIGTGGIALANHLPGISRCRDAAVTALCDANPSVLAEASRASGITRTWTDPDALIRESGVDAVIIATPNRWHYPITMAAVAAGMHVLCEKPIAMTLAEAMAMAAAGDRAGVRHMTAFTYRFVPAMRYMHRLVREGFVGEPWHFRAQRFQDWGRRFLAWRQRAADAGTGEIGDMLSHRIDYGHLLIGPIARVIASTRRVWDSRVDEDGVEHPSDLEDWVACIAEFEAGATGVLESTKLATACGEGARSRDRVEVNGADGSLFYELEQPHRLIGGRRGRGLEELAVPDDLLSYGGGPLSAGVDPQQAFRWDQDAEFIAAIREGRPCVPTLHAGARVQAVIEAIVAAAASRGSVDVLRIDAV
jgi:predicted dehydrogenase